jgi:hypothetical protein
MDLPAFIPLGTRVLCLYRVSTGQQLYRTENNEADIPMQRKRCRQFAEQMGWTVVCELQEEGVNFLIDSPTNQQFPIFSNAQLEKLSKKYRFSVW